MKASALISALLLTVSAPFAAAYSVVESQLIIGTVEKIDVENNLMIVNKSFGNTETIALPSNSNFEIQGETANLADFSAGDKVRVARKTVTPVSAPISGEIVFLNRSENSASIRTEEGKLVKVQFSDNLRVSGIVKSNSIDVLRKGHLVSIAAK